MEVMMPVHDMDFDFNSARSSPYPSPPSTPKRFGDYYCSAPSSPSRLTEFYREFDDFSIESSSGEHFDWQVKPGAMKSPKGYTKTEEDFAFDVGDEVNDDSASAEELFDGGMIKPMMKPPSQRRVSLSYSSLSSPSSKKTIMAAFSPKHKKEHVSPFASAAQKGKKAAPERERGRERAPGLSSSSRRATRSLSPLRVSQYPWEEEEEEQELLQSQKQTKNSMAAKPPSGSSTALTTSSAKGGQRKWRLKDFFLFRSASEGRASDKDPLKKYTAFFRKVESPSAAASVSSRGRRRGPVSAHELHYAANRAAKEDLKKKTFLPYKQGILGRLSFNPAVHALANGFPFHK